MKNAQTRKKGAWIYHLAIAEKWAIGGEKWGVGMDGDS